MAKNIVLLSDGTGNSAAKLFKTNVWRVYQALDLQAGDQIAAYDGGVGTARFKPLAVLGGAVGLGLMRNVIDLYAFLCRNYVEGDRLYGFGFSRGAFTIRSLVGLICGQGIVRADSEAALREQVYLAYARHREVFRTNWELLYARLRGADSAGRREPLGPVPDIEFLGLWDTVAAYGLPIDELQRGIDRYLYAMAFPDHDLSPSVLRACHALALDDERRTFHPVLWNERDAHSQRISQVWFTGAHSDVGGGYPDDALSYVSLSWILAEAQKAGLRFKPEAAAQIRATADIHGTLHDSRAGLSSYYRYAPRKLAVFGDDDYVKVHIERPKIHESVLLRIKERRTPYAPTGIPAVYDVVRLDGSVVAADPLLAADAPLHFESAQQAALRAGAAGLGLGTQERAWDLIWWRRLVYFATLAASLYLLVFPAVFGNEDGQGCQGRLCFISSVLESLDAIAPAPLGIWIQAFSANPGPFLIGAIALVLALTASGDLARRIADQAEAAWGHLKRHRESAPAYRAGIVYRLRNASPMSAIYLGLARSILPAGFFACLVVVGLLCANQVAFKLASSVGLICTRSPVTKPVGDDAVSIDFAIANPCQATGYRLEHGRRYAIGLRQTEPWFDSYTPVPRIDHGFSAASSWATGWEVAAVMYAATPLKRHPTENWAQPFARIGAEGTDHYLLRPGIFSARTDGELFLFVNDAVITWPGRWSSSYRNNQGRAEVMLWRISTDYADR